MSSTGRSSPARLTRPATLHALQNKDLHNLRSLGGVSGLARAICSHERDGLDPGAAAGSPQSVGEHARVFGPNSFQQVPSKNFFALAWENVQDPIILLLVAAALVRAPLAGGGGRGAWPTRMQAGGHVSQCASCHGQDASTVPAAAVAGSGRGQPCATCPYLPLLP
jgi:hypothetical protein